MRQKQRKEDKKERHFMKKEMNSNEVARMEGRGVKRSRFEVSSTYEESGVESNSNDMEAKHEQSVSISSILGISR